MLSRGIAAAFPRWRDRLMLAALAALAIGVAYGEAPQALLRDWRADGAIGAGIGWLAARALVSRLAWHRAEGVLAAEALERAPGIRLLAAGLGLALAALVLAGLAARAAALPWLLLGYGAGTLAGLAAPRMGWTPRRRGAAPLRGATTPLQVVAGTQMPFGWSPLGAAVVIVAVASLAAAAWFAGAWAPIALAAGLVASLSLLGRVDAAVVRFLAAEGYGPWRSASLHLAAGGALLVSTAVIAAGDFRGLATVLLIATGFALLTIFRVWAYRAYSRRAADGMLSLYAGGVGLAGMLMPPLLIPVLGYLAFTLHRRAARATWVPA